MHMDVMTQIGKEAASCMVKEAVGPPPSFWWNMLNPAKKAVSGLAKAAPKAAPRMGLGGKALLGGGAAIAGGHAYNKGKEMFAPESAYQSANMQLAQQTHPMTQQIEAASRNFDVGKQDQLNQQLTSGNYGASPWSLGGLNPFASGSAKSNMGIMERTRDRSMGAFNQANLGNSTEEIQTRIGGLESQLANPQLPMPIRLGLESQLNMYKSRIGNERKLPPAAAARRYSMMGAGMGDPLTMPHPQQYGSGGGQAPQQPGMPQQSASPADGWDLPSTVEAWRLNPQDFAVR